MKVEPIFLFSLPRSGSTLMQRMLAKHPEVSTVTEPWILLPLLYALQKEGVAAEYGHVGVSAAVTDLIETLPAGEKDYLKSVADFATGIYSKSSAHGSRYFLDKTPRNSLVVHHILNAFPNAKFIYLWRHPLAIAASMIETFGHGRWNLYRFEVDLYKGLDCLLASAKKSLVSPSQVKYLRYEDLVQNPEQALSELYDFLDIVDCAVSVEDALEDNLSGRLGDPTGVKAYKKVSTASLDKWKSVLNTPLRKRWAKGYLEHIGKDNLAMMGYEMDELMHELANVSCVRKYMVDDIFKMTYGRFYTRFNVPVLKRSLLGKKGWNYPLY